jgi:membrane-associated phospholipid phosphatase
MRYCVRMAEEADTNTLQTPCHDRPSIEAAMGWFSIALALVTLLSFLSFMHWDLPVTQWATGRPVWLHKVLDVLTKLGDSAIWLVPTGVLAVYFFFIRKRPRVGLVWAVAFAAVALTGLFANFVKMLIGRHRPKGLFESNLFGFAPLSYGYKFNSMPSGHSTTCGAVLVLLWLYFPRWRWLIVPCALFIASTRIWVTAHYLSDVFTGLLVGATGTFAIYYIAVGAGWISSPPAWKKGA